MRLPRRFLHPFCLCALVLALALLAWDSSLRLGEVARKTAVSSVSTDSPALDSKSPTGYALGQRNLILPYEAADSYHWIMQTQQMFADGQPRVRQVNYDNAPAGREVHWASPFRWWLGACAWLHHKVTGESLPISVEHSAPYANPLLLALMLLLLTPVVAQRFGTVAGALFALSSAAIGPYYWFFAASIPDHHGIATLCGGLCVLFLVAGGGGWLRRPAANSANMDAFTRWLPELSQARYWFVLSGIAGGCGLWISAASQSLVLVGIGVAAILSSWLADTEKTDLKAIAYNPALWRIWGLAGAATSLIAYLIEYFPSCSDWRLEVNHPLYALAWAGAGKLLHTFGRWRISGKWTHTPHDSAVLVLASLSVIILPGVAFLTAADTFWVADPFLFQIHKNHIQEFQPLISFFKSRTFFATLMLCLPLLAFVPAGLWLRRFREKPVLRSLLILAFTPAASLLIFSFGQSRWFGVACGLLVAGFVLLSWIASESGLTRRARFLVPTGLLLCLVFTPARTFSTWKAGPTTTKEDIYQLALRDLAHWLRARSGTEPCVVASSPTLSTFLVFHGGVQGLGTFYWENLPGLRTTGELFAAQTETEAYQTIRTHGITHIVMVSWDDFLTEYIRLVRKIPRHEPTPDNAFFVQLAKTKILPPWLRLASYRFSSGKTLENQSVLVFEVVPPQASEASLVNLINFLLDTGEVKPAVQLAPALDRFSTYLPALIAMGRVRLQQNEPTAIESVMASLKLRLNEAGGLSLEDHIHLGCLLAYTGDVPAAREQLARCAARFNEHDVRRLSSRATFNFLHLAPRLGVPSPSPEMLALAFEMLPPASNDQLRASMAAPAN